MMCEDNNLHLADLIQGVKNELIESSRRSEEDQEENGTPYLFALEEVELELKFSVETAAGGGANFIFYSAEGSLASTREQTAKIKFKIHKTSESKDNIAMSVHHMHPGGEAEPEGTIDLGLNHLIDKDTI